MPPWSTCSSRLQVLLKIRPAGPDKMLDERKIFLKNSCQKQFQVKFVVISIFASFWPSLDSYQHWTSSSICYHLTTWGFCLVWGLSLCEKVFTFNVIEPSIMIHSFCNLFRLSTNTYSILLIDSIKHLFKHIGSAGKPRGLPAYLGANRPRQCHIASARSH